MGQAGSWDNYDLLGPFFVGMMLGKGDSGTVMEDSWLEPGKMPAE